MRTPEVQRFIDNHCDCLSGRWRGEHADGCESKFILDVLEMGRREERERVLMEIDNTFVKTDSIGAIVDARLQELRRRISEGA